MGISVEWTKHLKDDESKESFIATLRNSTTALGRLLDIVEEDEKNLVKSSTADYDSPSWAFLSAHKNGELAYLRKLKQRLLFIRGNND